MNQENKIRNEKWNVTNNREIKNHEIATKNYTPIKWKPEEMAKLLEIKFRGQHHPDT